MLDTREKLIELIEEAEEWADHRCDELECVKCPTNKMEGSCMNQLMVQRLIEKGVTVQRWIPVTERLPVEEARQYFAMYEEWQEFIVMIEGAEYPTTLMFDGNDWTDGFDICNVTHWMPLPEPPKEGEK